MPVACLFDRIHTAGQGRGRSAEKIRRLDCRRPGHRDKNSASRPTSRLISSPPSRTCKIPSASALMGKAASISSKRSAAVPASSTSAGTRTGSTQTSVFAPCRIAQISCGNNSRLTANPAVVSPILTATGAWTGAISKRSPNASCGSKTPTATAARTRLRCLPTDSTPSSAAWPPASSRTAGIFISPAFPTCGNCATRKAPAPPTNASGCTPASASTSRLAGTICTG